MIPTYDLFLIGLGPLVLGLVVLLFRRTRFGVLVRAATQDREMVAALGVNQKWLFTGVFGLGVFLAAFGGALQISRDAVSHTMDLAGDRRDFRGGGDRRPRQHRRAPSWRR